LVPLVEKSWAVSTYLDHSASGDGLWCVALSLPCPTLVLISAVALEPDSSAVGFSLPGDLAEIQYWKH